MTDRPRYTAPMPDDLRHHMRAGAHPARSVPCGHCGARVHQPCVLRKTGRTLRKPHPQRITAWAVLVACCPECQVEPTVPCHDDGKALASHHPRPEEEAKETCA